MICLGVRTKKTLVLFKTKANSYVAKGGRSIRQVREESGIDGMHEGIRVLL